MKHSRTILFSAISLALALLIAACGSSTTTGGGGGPYGGSSNNKATPTSTTGSASAMTMKTATLTVGGKSMVVLTNAQGMTLYYRTSDTPTSVVYLFGRLRSWAGERPGVWQHLVRCPHHAPEHNHTFGEYDAYAWWVSLSLICFTRGRVHTQKPSR